MRFEAESDTAAAAAAAAVPPGHLATYLVSCDSGCNISPTPDLLLVYSVFIAAIKERF